MTDVPKPDAEAPSSVTGVEYPEAKGSHTDVDSPQRENAVGYNEYLEARDLEFSDAEVCCISVSVLPERHSGVSS